MSELERRLADYRRRVLQRDQQAALSLIAAFGQALDRIRPAAELLQWEIDELGKTNITRILSLDRYVMLERQIVDEMNALARQTGTSVRGAEAEMIQLGAEAALRLVEASAADPTISAGFTRVNPDAVRELVGATEPDSPVGKLLDSFGEDAAKLLRETLVTAVATGTNPRPVAAALQAATGMSATRAMAISRTEILRAYRTSQLAHYAANDDILKGWKWLSAKQRRTCAACLAMDGTVFPLSQTFFPAHVNCRCSARPVLKDEYAAKRDPVESGADWLARQSAETQDAILGKQGGAAYRAGEVQLGDFVRTDKHPTWGESKRDGGLAWARANAEKRSKKATRKKAQPQQVAVKQVPKPVEQYDDGVGAMINAPDNAFGERMRGNAATIDSVHAAPGLPPVEVRRLTNKDSHGEYKVNEFTNAPEHIGVNDKSKFPDLAFIHETGHYIDNQLLSRWSARNPPQSGVLNRFMEVASESKAMKQLFETRMKDTVPYVAKSGKVYQYEVDQYYLRYLTGPDEVFARAYAQWVTLRSGSPILRAQLEEVRADSKRGGYPEQWDDDDFLPLADELDRVFREKGWLR